MSKKKKEEEMYRVTPKGLAWYAMLQCGLLTDPEDPRFEGFWTLFTSDMKRQGYVQENEEETA